MAMININKAKPCRHFEKGYCKYGAHCCFAHGPAELLVWKPVLLAGVGGSAGQTRARKVGTSHQGLFLQAKSKSSAACCHAPDTPPCLTKECQHLIPHGQDDAHPSSNIASLQPSLEVAAETAAKAFGLKGHDVEEADDPVQLLLTLESVSRTLRELAGIGERVAQAFKALEDATTCSLTLHTLQRPVLAPDGQAYEESWIVPWVQRRGLSPLTKEPIKLHQLVRDRPLEQAARALRILKGVTPEEEMELDKEYGGTDHTIGQLVHTHGDVGHERMQEDHTSEPAGIVVGMELVYAIRSRREDSALSMLARAVNPAVLNVHYGEDKASLLHLALIRGLPLVAKALLNRRDFTQAGHWLGAQPSVSTMHLAAACGDLYVCEALLARRGAQEAQIRAKHEITLQLYDGTLVEIRYLNTPIGLSQRFKHPAVHELLISARGR